MAKEEIVRKWTEQVEEDISTAEDLHKTGHWLYVAFMCHQAIEKSIKAYWYATRDDDPPYIHNHYKLLDRCGLTGELTEEQERFLELMTPMYIAARYPEYKRQVARMLNEDKCANMIDDTKKMIQWILRKC